MELTPALMLMFFGAQMSLFGLGSVALLLHRRDQRDRSRLYIGLMMAGLAIACVTCVCSAMMSRSNPGHFMHCMLQPYPSINSFLLWILLPMYLMEVRRPNRMRGRRVLLFMLPWIVVSASFLLWHALSGFPMLTELRTLGDVAANMDEVDVVFRLLLVLLFVPYGLSVFFLPYNWRTSNAPQPWMRILNVLACVCAFTFILGMMLRIMWLMMLHMLVMDSIAAIILYVEFYVRIPVPEQADLSVSTQVGSETDDASSQTLAQRLSAMMADHAWQNPDLQQSDICRLLGTNRNYLMPAIRDLGYANYSDMINRYRVEYIHQRIESDPKSKLLDLFFEAGYRSRNTASRCFQQYYGCSPLDFQRQRS